MVCGAKNENPPEGLEMAGDMSYNTGYHNEDNTDNEVEYMEEVRSFGYICPKCGGTHQAEVDVSAILTGRGVGLACPETKQLCCYAGDTRQVQSAMEELAIRAEKEKCEEKEAFTDNVIMYEVLSELKDIAARGGIRCTCGSAEYGIQVHRDAVDLICRRCGGKLRLPAGTDEDLDRLCCQMKLTIRGAE